MSEKNQNKKRKSQMSRSRITKEVTDSMTEADQKRMHITPSTKELMFARDYLIRESQKMNCPEEYETLQNGNSNLKKICSYKTKSKT